MKSGLVLVFFAVCAFAAAMVPREKRAVNSEELPVPSTSTTTQKPQEICAPQTPCAWSIYKPRVRIVELNITNTYCVCSANTVCQQSEDDSNVNAYIYKCRPPVEPEENADGAES